MAEQKRVTATLATGTKVTASRQVIDKMKTDDSRKTASAKSSK